jgi:hypothetical protein
MPVYEEHLTSPCNAIIKLLEEKTTVVMKLNLSAIALALLGGVKAAYPGDIVQYW